MTHLSDGDLTHDEILRGRLRLWQPRVGYRFSVDSLLLAHFVSSSERAARRGLGRVVDLCSGVGVIGLALARADEKARVTLVELVPRIAELARRNADENGLGARVAVERCDVADARAMKERLRGASHDLVVSSPPFFATAAGPTVDESEEALARHELKLSLADLAREARRLLVPGGRAAIVYPSDRLLALLGALDAEGVRPTRLRFIHPRAEAPAQRALVEAQKGARAGLVVEPPLVVRAGEGYTDEVKRALGD